MTSKKYPRNEYTFLTPDNEGFEFHVSQLGLIHARTKVGDPDRHPDGGWFCVGLLTEEQTAEVQRNLRDYAEAKRQC
jgi:hypothetical protein